MILTQFSDIIFTIIAVIIIAAIIFYSILYYTYKKFLLENSISINNLKKINKEYTFNKIGYFNYIEYYDNKIYFEKLEPVDLLIYKLVKDKFKVAENICKVNDNIRKYKLYISEVNKVKHLGEFTIEKNIKFKRILLEIEDKLFDSFIKNPKREYSIKSTIVLTNINGVKLKGWWQNFNEKQIEELLDRISDKTNDRYNDQGVWDSISKIERAKVTNKLRFFIYERDGHRCCKCGRRTKDLEIDHIMPISKGGKTHPDNLQTLCRRCNKEKSNIIEAGTFFDRDKSKRFCPKCGAPLKKINGKHGVFYGCMNYPNCNYTEK